MDISGNHPLAGLVGPAAEQGMYRPSRTNYPGSRFGPKTRYDLPSRRESYGNADEAETILFKGTSLQPQVWGHGGTGGHGTRDGLGLLNSPRSTSLPSSSHRAPIQTLASMPRTPRISGIASGEVLSDTARAILHPLAERNLPELPLISESNDVQGVLVLGGKGCGKTALILSLEAAVTGEFPHGQGVKEKRHTMPMYGQNYEFPERDVRLFNGIQCPMRLVLTDTPPCGTNVREEEPLCSSISPNSGQHYNAIPSWMRITMRSGNYPHSSVLFVIDATAQPLWEDSKRCRELARLLAVLKRNRYTVVLAVTKLLRVREAALRDAAHQGHAAHGRQVGRDPRSSYESFAGRYLDKICASLQAKAHENDWSFSSGPDSPPFPLVNSTIFDAPTWVSLLDHKTWQERKGTVEKPNMQYYMSQLQRILSAVSIRSHPD